jgi:hypothetical protein
MSSRALAVTALSLLLCVATVALWVRSCWITDAWYSKPSAAHPVQDPTGYSINFDRQWRVALEDGYLSVTRTDRPVRANIQPGHHSHETLHMRGSFAIVRYENHAPSFPPARAPGRFGTVFGVWQLEVRLSLLAGAFAVLPVIAFFRMAHVRRAGRTGKCLRCGYDLRASIDRCPACGTPILTEAKA